jgi:hypothetical protein
VTHGLVTESQATHVNEDELQIGKSGFVQTAFDGPEG